MVVPAPPTYTFPVEEKRVVEEYPVGPTVKIGLLVESMIWKRLAV